jgi:predicted RNA-binding Zn-ribbon protein involved in translation (DUF1610 family)
LSDPDKRRIYDIRWPSIARGKGQRSEAERAREAAAEAERKKAAKESREWEDQARAKAKAAEAERKRAAEEKLRQEKERKNRPSRIATLRALKAQYESEIFEANRTTRRLDGELRRLKQLDGEEAQREEARNSWSAYISSLFRKREEETEEQKQRREYDALQRRASTRIKDSRLKSNEEVLKNLSSKRNAVDGQLEDEIRKQVEEDQRQENLRQEKLRKEREEKERKDREEGARQEQLRQDILMKEAKERYERIMKEAQERARQEEIREKMEAERLRKIWEENQRREVEEQKAQKRAREARENEQARRRKEERQRRAYERAEDLQRKELFAEAQRELEKHKAQENKKADFMSWVKEQQRRNGTKAQESATPSQGSQARTRSAPYKRFHLPHDDYSEASPSQSTTQCKHNTFWPKIDGRHSCMECQEVQNRFALKCPECGIIACANCRRHLRS